MGMPIQKIKRMCGMILMIKPRMTGLIVPTKNRASGSHFSVSPPDIQRQFLPNCIVSVPKTLLSSSPICLP